MRRLRLIRSSSDNLIFSSTISRSASFLSVISSCSRVPPIVIPPVDWGVINGVPYGAPLFCYDADNGDWENVNDGTFLFRITTNDDFKVIGMGQTAISSPIAYVIFGTNAAATGNAYCEFDVTHYAPGSTTLTTYSSGFQAIAVGGVSPDWYWYVPVALSLTITNAVAGDIIRFVFRRDGANVNDTFSGSIDVLGFILV